MGLFHFFVVASCFISTQMSHRYSPAKFAARRRARHPDVPFRSSESLAATAIELPLALLPICSGPPSSAAVELPPEVPPKASNDVASAMLVHYFPMLLNAEEAQKVDAFIRNFIELRTGPTANSGLQSAAASELPPHHGAVLKPPTCAALESLSIGAPEIPELSVDLASLIHTPAAIESLTVAMNSEEICTPRSKLSQVAATSVLRPGAPCEFFGLSDNEYNELKLPEVPFPEQKQRDGGARFRASA